MKIGSIKLQRPIALAPMEDITDLPFRSICKKLGADLVYTEFTSSEAIIRDIDKAMRKINVSDEERPVAIQLFGGVERSMEKAAEIAEKCKPDFIDINCGCWTKRHALRSEGSGLLLDLKLFERIVKSVVRATKLPVTVKTRLGWNKESIVILDVARMVEQAGAKALAVHCRTRCQGYKGKADWEWLPEIKKVISIPLIGNGDVTAPEHVKNMFELGCDGVMIGRGAVANPWLFKEAKYYMKTGKHLPQPTVKTRITLCLQHLRSAIHLRGLREGVLTFRKYYAGYLKGLPYAAKVRKDLMELTDYDAIEERLHRFAKELEKR